MYARVLYFVNRPETVYIKIPIMFEEKVFYSEFYLSVYQKSNHVWRKGILFWNLFDNILIKCLYYQWEYTEK